MKQDWRPLALVTQLGLTVVTSLVLSLLLGLWLDSLLGTKPLLTLVFSLIGIMAGTVGVYRLITQAIAEATSQTGARPAGDHRPAPPTEREDRGDEDGEGDSERDDEEEGDDRR